MEQISKRIRNIIALLMALVMLSAALAGCKLPDGQDSDQITIDTTKTDSAETAEETPLPEPTFLYSEDAETAFRALDLEVFTWYATQDGISYHMFVDDPTVYNIDHASVKMTLGEFTEEDSARIAVEAKAFLERLSLINREQIKQESQLPYDVLEEFLQDLAMDDTYAYLYEPLTEYSGLHSEMPLVFALFDLKNVQDVEDYLTLLADMPRYMGQVLAYEQKRAELNIFMTEESLTAVLEDCKTIINSKDTSFLYVTFEEAIDKLTELTPEQAKAYKDRNISLLKNEFINSYQTLYDGLTALKSKCRTYDKVTQYSDVQKAYYEYRMQDAGCTSLSVEEALEMLKKELNYLFYDYLLISSQNPDITEEKVNFTSGDTSKDIDYLVSMIEPLLPKLPEHTLTIEDVPLELQKQFAPAAYVIPAMDDWKDNTIFINTYQKDPTYLLTLAHEGYPGHMYQYIYQRSMDDLGLVQRAANFSGYAEGWAQFAEFLTTEYQNQYDKDLVRFYFDYSQIVNTILPAMISILANYYGYTEDAIEKVVEGWGFDGELLTDYYYKTVIDQPYYFFAYAIGYCEVAQLYRDTKNELGDKFDLPTYLKTYLDLGPGSFDLIKEKMGVWTDEMLQDVG